MEKIIIGILIVIILIIIIKNAPDSMEKLKEKQDFTKKYKVGDKYYINRNWQNSSCVEVGKILEVKYPYVAFIYYNTFYKENETVILMDNKIIGEKFDKTK